MAAGGPSKEVKRENSAQDTSHNIQETWLDLSRNFIIISLIAVTVWGFCSSMRWAVEESSEFLFAPFQHHSEHEKAPHQKQSEHIAIATHTEPTTLNEESTQIEPSKHQEKSEHITTPEHHTESKGDTALGPWIIFGVLILGGIIRGLLIQLPSWKGAEGDGVATSLEDFHATYDYKQTSSGHQPRYENATFGSAIRRVIMTSLTVGTGGSGGLEAPVLPIGECIAAGWAKLFRTPSPDDLRIYQMSGIAAAVATLLDAPFTAALFAAEILYTDRMVYRPLLYSLLGAIVAYALNNHFLHFEPLFTISTHSHLYTLTEYAQVALVALICSAPAGITVNIVFVFLKDKIQKVHSIARAGVGAIGAGAIALTLWFTLGIEPQHILGVGEETLKQVMEQQGNPLLQVWWVLLLLVAAKTLATGLTLMAGGSAGSLVPAMYMGGVTGGAVYYALVSLGIPAGPDPSLFVVTGIASGLVAVIDVPLAAIAFVMEVFGSHYGPPAIVACILCHMIVKRLKLYG